MDLMTLAAAKQYIDEAVTDGATSNIELNNIKNRLDNIAAFSDDSVIITTNITNNIEDEAEE